MLHKHQQREEREGFFFQERRCPNVGSKVIWYWSRTLWGVTAFITREGKTKKKMWHTKPKIRGFRIGKDVSAQESFHLDCQKLLKHGFIGNQSHLERVRCFVRKGSVEVFYFACDFLLFPSKWFVILRILYACFAALSINKNYRGWSIIDPLETRHPITFEI